MNRSLILSSTTTDYTIRLDDPILISVDNHCEAALTALYTYNSCPNITHENNRLRYSCDVGVTWKDITFATGAYELAEINSEIQRQMVINNDYRKDSQLDTFYIKVTINKPTSKSQLEINDENYIVDFNVTDSIASTLGFDNKKYTCGIHESPNVIDIEKVNAILIHCDLVTGSSINGINSQVIYSFSPKVSPGYKIIEIPSPQLYYHPVINQSYIDRVHIWITDQNNRIVDLRGEKITVCIHLRVIDNTARVVSDIKSLIEKYV